MNEVKAVETLVKSAKKAKLKSKLLAIASGIVAGLMYKAGVEYGAYATAAQVASLVPEESTANDEDRNN